MRRGEWGMGNREGRGRGRRGERGGDEEQSKHFSYTTQQTTNTLNH